MDTVIKIAMENILHASQNISFHIYDDKVYNKQFANKILYDRMACI